MTVKLLKQLIIGMDKKDQSCEISLVTLHSVGMILSSPMWTLAFNSTLQSLSSYIFVNCLVSLSLATIFTFAQVSLTFVIICARPSPLRPFPALVPKKILHLLCN